mmetsp:Transcript_26338/g.47259  ORF Transcript_26338/g.47259 Transcript_26338/m.47259 type:complete len:265 (-) Transcript_26338:1117-1911(-)
MPRAAAISTKLPSDIHQTLMDILSDQAFSDDYAQHVRERLTRAYEDRWHVIVGQTFAYAVSRAAKGAGLYSVKFETSLVVKVLVYSIPHIEVLAPISYRTDSSPISINWSTDTFNDPSLKQICSELLGNYIIEDADAAQALKARLNEHSTGHWQVIIGTHFKYSLNPDELQGVLYGKHKDHGILVYRQIGLKRKVNWKNIGSWTVSLFGAFMLFLGVIGMLRCQTNPESFLCVHNSKCLYMGLAYVFSKAFKKLISYRTSKAKR